MRIALAVLAASLAISPATGSSLGTAHNAENAAKLLADWCVSTDASLSKAEKRIESAKLPPSAITMKPIPGGMSLRLEPSASASIELELDAAAGKVRSCNVDVTLSHPEATFDVLQKQYHIGGNIDDYEPGHNTWFEIASPAKVPLSAIVFFQITTATTGERVGRMTAVVMPAGKTGGQ
jgi:hypothetical protein